ncbi:hypothetical protein G6F68_012432 [Rhizopus microsporus]|nr:hypothetical protein G6F68_012432 [Rhizopus microsporus]
MVMNNENLQQPAVPSQETPHVVLSQMSILSPSTPSPSVVNSMHQIKGTNVSLHNAVVHQQHHQQQIQCQSDPMVETVNNNKRAAAGSHAYIERKKSRRHTVSNGNPPILNIDTKNLPVLSSSPRSAVVVTQQGQQYQVQPFTRSEERQAFIDKQKKSLGTINIPPPPTPQELGIIQPSSTGISAKKYDGLSRAQLISRLIELETEKLQNRESQNEKFKCVSW